MPISAYYQKTKNETRGPRNEYLKNWRKRTGNHGERPGYIDLPENKLKIKARQIINRAILRGEIVRELCSIDGCSTIGQAHHEDYDKPLEVNWLCAIHHAELHAGKGKS